MNNRAISNHNFHESATTISTGKDYIITSNEDICKLDFNIANGTTFETKVYVKVDINSTWKVIPMVKDLTCTIITNGTINDASSNYTIDLRGITYLRVDLINITGTVSVLGKMVG